MKRIALVLALVMTLSLFAGCKTDEGSSTASGTDSQGGSTSTTDTITIGMPVSYTHLDVYKRQISFWKRKRARKPRTALLWFREPIILSRRMTWRS